MATETYDFTGMSNSSPASVSGLTFSTASTMVDTGRWKRITSSGNVTIASPTNTSTLPQSVSAVVHYNGGTTDAPKIFLAVVCEDGVTFNSGGDPSVGYLLYINTDGTMDLAWYDPTWNYLTTIATLTRVDGQVILLEVSLNGSNQAVFILKVDGVQVGSTYTDTARTHSPAGVFDQGAGFQLVGPAGPTIEISEIEFTGVVAGGGGSSANLFGGKLAGLLGGKL